MFPIFSCCFNVMVTSQSMYPFLAYLGLENWALWILAGANMYCLISYSVITGDILYLQHWLWLRIFKEITLTSKWCQERKKWRQYQNEKYVIVKAQMTLDHNMLIDPPLPLLEYCTIYALLKLHDIRYKMTHVSSLTCNSHVNYVTLL